MIYVGLDYHLRTSTLCVLDSNGKKLYLKTLKGYWPKVVEELIKIKKQYRQKMVVCFEASGSSGHLYDRLSAVCNKVFVANPSKLRLIFKSKRKNDKVDASKLALLLLLKQVPTVYIPCTDVRAWRKIIEYRSKLVAKRTRVKNSIRSLLKSTGIIAVKGLWTKKGMEWLEQVEMENDIYTFNLEILLEELSEIQDKLKRAEKILNKKGKAHAGVTLLMTIPGIGPRTGEALVAYIDNPDRFSRISNIGSYFGVVPSQFASGDHNRMGHITKEGPGTVRRLLTEAAWFSIRHSKTTKAYYERIMRGDPNRKKIAIVATTHYLSRVSLSMLKSGEVWREAA